MSKKSFRKYLKDNPKKVLEKKKLQKMWKHKWYWLDFGVVPQKLDF